MLSAASRLAQLGLAVHWVQGPDPSQPDSGKAPVHQGWQQAPWRSPEALAASYHPGYNLGIHCGLVEGAAFSLVAMDLDSAESLQWARERFPVPGIRTRTRKGEHWFYRHPGAGIVIRSTKLPGRQNDHIRGDGGQVVCAPSIHYTGFVYQEVEPWTAEALAALPIFDPAWTPAPRVVPIQTRLQGISTHRANRWAHAALEGALQELQAAGKGNRNNTLNAVCYRVGRLVAGGWLSQTEAQSSLESTARSIGLATGEIPKTIRSGLLSGAQNPHPGPADQTTQPAPIPDQTYIAAAVLHHGQPALDIVRQHLSPSDFFDPQAHRAVTIAWTMPGPSRDNILAEAPDLPQEWDQIGPSTDLQELQQRVEHLAAERPPELPAEYFDENPEIPRFPIQIDTSGWGPDPTPPATPDHTLRLRSNSHVAIAEEIIHRIVIRTGAEPVFAEGKLWSYNGGRGIWEPFEGVEPMVQSLDGLDYGSRIVRGHEYPLGQLNLKRSDIEGAIKCMHQALREDRWFHRALPGIAFRNCFVQCTPQGLRVIRNHSENRARFAYDFDYDAVWHCHGFGRVLGELFAPDRDSLARKAALFEFIGASLIGIVTSYQKALVFTGPPGCGKSVVFEILKSIFPPESVVAVLPEEMHMQWEKVRLAGARLNACDELNGFTISAVGTLKAGITGNVIQGRIVGEQGFDFRPICGFLLSFNRPPKFADISGGLEDRLIVYRFSRRFRDTPGDNKHLARDIIDTEKPEIVAAALEGACRLMAQGRYTQVPSSREALQDWSEQNNPILLFSRECLERLDRYGAKWEAVYARYKKWAEDNGYKNLQTAHQLKATLQGLGFKADSTWITARLV